VQNFPARFKKNFLKGKKLTTKTQIKQNKYATYKVIEDRVKIWEKVVYQIYIAYATSTQKN
jgi:hypothetical protein